MLGEGTTIRRKLRNIPEDPKVQLPDYENLNLASM
jgi:hypothetical protein